LPQRIEGESLEFAVFRKMPTKQLGCAKKTSSCAAFAAIFMNPLPGND
jgi:hypothetical protein